MHHVSSPGTDSALALTMKQFVSHATCRDSLGLQEQETYLIMGHTSDLWRVRSQYAEGPLLSQDSGVDPFPHPGPIPDVNTSHQRLSPNSRSLGFLGCPEGTCMLCTAQFQRTPFTRKYCRCRYRFGFPIEGCKESEEGEPFRIPSHMG